MLALERDNIVELFDLPLGKRLASDCDLLAKRSDRHRSASPIRPCENDVSALDRNLENVVDILDHNLPLNATRQHVSEATTWIRFKIYDPLKQSFTGQSFPYRDKLSPQLASKWRELLPRHPALVRLT